MKFVKTSLVLFGLIAAACGQNQTDAGSKQAVYAEDKMPTELKEKVPYFMIMKVDQTTGAVTTAVTNEQMANIDTSTEEGRIAFAKSEAEIFERAKKVNVLEGDADLSESSSESFWWGGSCGGNVGVGCNNVCGGSGFGFGFGFGSSCSPYLAVGGVGFNYGLLGGSAMGGCGFYRFGVSSFWGSNSCGSVGCSSVPFWAYQKGFNNGYGYGFGNGYNVGYQNGFQDGSMIGNPGYGPYVAGQNHGYPGYYPYY